MKLPDSKIDQLKQEYRDARYPGDLVNDIKIPESLENEKNFPVDPEFETGNVHRRLRWLRVGGGFLAASILIGMGFWIWNLPSPDPAGVETISRESTDSGRRIKEQNRGWVGLRKPVSTEPWRNSSGKKMVAISKPLPGDIWQSKKSNRKYRKPSSRRKPVSIWSIPGNRKSSRRTDLQRKSTRSIRAKRKSRGTYRSRVGFQSGYQPF